ncbi:Oxidoreductase, NAD-binding domain protein [Leptospira santarosai]|uniref:Oxidoreductase, NAD-binding domain protein n=1 Tax=Leptospira santarosai TaxID=28183 RepID=A0A2P1QVW3_9LEPT|nr:Oxidoreductase, NAD-binding domain protein [Leptospira santarosai]
MNPLKQIIGSIVKEINFIEDYLQIKFTNETIININNNFDFNGDDISSIEQKELISIFEDNSKIDLNFKNNLTISISLLDKDYNGPEAMELYQKGKPPVIWN